MKDALQYIATTPATAEQTLIWFGCLLGLALLFIGSSNIQR